MRLNFSKSKVISVIIAALILVIAIFGNIALTTYAATIHSWFAGNSAKKEVLSETAQNTLGFADDFVQELAADSMVLLKNENGCLPLKKGTKLNLFGYNATDKGFMITGGGSGGSNPVDSKLVTLLQAFQDAGVQYNQTLTDAYNAWDTYDMDSNSGAQSVLSNPPASFYTDALIHQAKEYSDTAVVVLSRFGRENSSLTEIPFTQQKRNAAADNSRTYLQTSTEEDVMLEKVMENFDNVIVLLNLCNVMECGFLDDGRIDAAMYIGTTGQSGTRAIPKLLYGDITPSGRTADVYAYHHKNDPTWANATYSGSNIVYQEGIYYGYRWYETAFADKVKLTVNGTELDFSTEEGYDKIVQYPFGYGLSYTDFSWEVVEAPADGAEIQEYGEYTVKVRVTNTGTRPGKEVVQLYATPPYTAGGIEKSAMNLIAFAKTEELLPANMTENGVPESQVVELKFTDYSLASYDCYDANKNGLNGYELEKGTYEIKLMKNAHDPATVIPSAASEDSVITMELKKWDIWIAFDHETNEFVENRFTGNDSYGSPVDGGVSNYMSRSNFSSTFPTTRATGHSSKSYTNKYEQLKTVTYSQDAGMYFVTKQDGSKPTLSELSGETGTELQYNEELLKKLHDYDDTETWDKFLSQISKEETLNLIKNGGFQVSAVESLGLPRLVESDGPSGISDTVLNANVKQERTAYPSQALIGCSFNKKMAYNMGRVVGMEAKNVVNVNGWYAPGVNLHRSPYTSRNFEYYSEDGVLSGELASEVIRGAKNNGLTCYLKHFAVSEAGNNPRDRYTWLTEQTLREIYFKPFEIAVKKGKANAVMSAFNRVGDIYAGFNQALLVDVLRTEWGFKGSVITDWWGSYMTVENCVLGGNDKMLLPNNTSQTVNLSNNSSESANAARTSVKNIIYTVVDSYMTAKNFALNGEENDPYAVSIDKISVQEAAKSPLFSAIWIGLNILFVVEICVCGYFFFKQKPEEE